MNEQKSPQIPLNNQRGTLVKQETTVTFSGPLPPPAVIEHYERILPGAAERIFKMAEEQSRHRRDMESRVINSDIKNSRSGLNYGLIIGLASLAAAVLIVYFGHPFGGGILGVGTVAGLVGVFVYGSQSRRKEREGRREQQIQKQ